MLRFLKLTNWWLVSVLLGFTAMTIGIGMRLLSLIPTLSSMESNRWEFRGDVFIYFICPVLVALAVILYGGINLDISPVSRRMAEWVRGIIKIGFLSTTLILILSTALLYLFFRLFAVGVALVIIYLFLEEVSIKGVIITILMLAIGTPGTWCGLGMLKEAINKK